MHPPGAKPVWVTRSQNCTDLETADTGPSGAVFNQTGIPAVLGPTEVPQAELIFQNGVHQVTSQRGATLQAPLGVIHHLINTGPSIPPDLGTSPSLGAGGGLCPIQLRPCKDHDVQKRSPFPARSFAWEGGRPSTAGHQHTGM